ncbi:hypothetical protein N0V88_001570 [Collariella sp. IMI 366227]|nr:hypothetical protein N0V88_001570 [Collariella sp. IMI 366227]
MSYLNGFEGLDPYISAYQSWDNHVLERGRIESELAMRYRDLVNRYREKCAECEREKRNAIVWEKEQSLTERELNGLKSAATALARFGRGFCRAQPLFSFTDVGYGKEQADNKVRKLFEIMEKNIQCRSLILGGCHDNGYAPFLESFRGNQKICLLETTPSAADFRRLSFKRVSFPSVFRSEAVPSKTAAPPGLPPASAFYQGTLGSPPPTINSVLGMAGLPSPAPTVSPKQAPSKPDFSANSYAAMSRSSAPLTINISSQKKTAPPRPFYQLNKNDQRVDVPLAKADPTAVKSLDDRRHKTGANMCNRYHLSGVCKNGENCSFTHGSRLPAAEILALRHKTRNLAATIKIYEDGTREVL